MIYTMNVDGINDLLHTACNMLLTSGKEVYVRNHRTWELRPVVIEISDPMNRTLLYPHRGNNPFGTVFESMWIYGSEDNNIECLAKFIPRAYDYADDGKNWRAGYPKRLRKYGHIHIDQIEYVFRKLREDTTTRQAIITLWNPEEDAFDARGELQKSLDFPCSNLLQFMIRDGKLDCMFVIRSNDCVFGMTAINVYEFTILQEILAGLLGIGMGSFYYIAGSLHFYEEHKEKVLQLAKMEPLEFDLPRFKFYEQGEGAVHYWLWADYQTEIARACKHVTDYVVPIKETYSRNISEMVKLCQLYLTFKDRESTAFEDFCDEMKEIRFSDLHCACMFWFMKHWKLIDPMDIAKAIEASYANNCSDIQSA